MNSWAIMITFNSPLNAIDISKRKEHVAIAGRESKNFSHASTRNHKHIKQCI